MKKELDKWYIIKKQIDIMYVTTVIICNKFNKEIKSG